MVLDKSAAADENSPSRRSGFHFREPHRERSQFMCPASRVNIIQYVELAVELASRSSVATHQPTSAIKKS